MNRRRFGIFLLISFLCAQTELYQFLKAPLLAIHYLEHKDINASFSLGQFFTMHYFSEQVKDDDYERDMQLPFKSHSDSIFPVSSALIPERFAVQTNFLVIERESRPFLPVHWFFIPHLNIWNPPKLSC